MAERLIILDVDGIRVLLLGAYPVGSSPDELLAIMSTLQLAVDPPASAKDARGLPPIGANLGTGAYAFAKGTLDGRTIAVAFRNAEGWSSQGWYLSSPAGDVGQSFLAAWGPNGLPGPIGTVYGDPCRRGGTGTLVAGGGEFLINAILGQRHRTSEPPVKVSIGGYQGVLLESVIGAMDWSTCQGGHAEAWVAAGGTARWIGPNTRQRIYVLDVGGTTLVLEGSYPDGIARDQLFAMMDSIRITLD